MNVQVRKVGDAKVPIWSTRLENGKGPKVYANTENAEKLMRDGNLVLRRCKAGDL